MDAGPSHSRRLNYVEQRSTDVPALGTVLLLVEYSRWNIYLIMNPLI